MAPRKLYWRYATVVIPAGTTINRAHDHGAMRLIVPLTVRAKCQVDRQDRNIGTDWHFIYGPYGYYVAITTAGVVSSDFRFVQGVW